jgi:heavy metal sensor kinase
LYFRSIRFSLTLWYSVTLAVILLLFSTFLYLTIRSRLYAEVDRGLLAIAEAVASPTLEPFRNSAPSVLDLVLEDFIGPKIAGKFVQLSDSGGRGFSHSKNLQLFTLPLNNAAVQAAGSGNITYQTHKGLQRYPIRSVVFPVMANARLSQIVQVGTPLEDATETLNKILLVIVVSIPLSLLLLWYAGWFLAGRALKPVELITSSAQKISAENLSHRLEIVNPEDEIGKLAVTFNRTLDRLENSFIRTRRFSSDVSHELRTPLTILRGETELGLRWSGDPDEFKKILGSNLEEINRMSEIIGYLLDLSRAEEDSLSLHLQRLDLKELLQDLVQQTWLLAEEKGIKFIFTASDHVYVSADGNRLRQIFLNLLDNAFKFIPAGGEIRLILAHEPPWAKVSVIDSGPGIPENDQPYIFDRFYRVDKARNREDGGSGLGLSLVKSLSEAHGGRVELQSSLGVGSVFTVYLPTIAS